MWRRMVVHEKKETRRIIILSLLLAFPASTMREIQMVKHMYPGQTAGTGITRNERPDPR